MSGCNLICAYFVSVTDHLFVGRIIMFRIEKLPGFSMISEILIVGEE